MTGFTSQYKSLHSLRQQVVMCDLCLWVPVCAITRDVDGADIGSRML